MFLNVPLVSLIFLKKSLVLPIRLFSSIYLHWLLRKAFLSLLTILWCSPFKWVYLSFSPLLFASLLFTAICKASSDIHFTFMHFFFSGIIFLLFFLLFFIFLLYNIVLVLPYFKMNPPQVYTCFPSWTLLSPPSPYHPLIPVSCTMPWTSIHSSSGTLSIRSSHLNLFLTSTV